MQLNTYLDVEVVALDADDAVTVMLDLQAPAAEEAGKPRPEHTAVVVLDRSGSMGGGRFSAAKQALLALIDRLDDRDRFGLVTFGSSVSVAVPAGRVGELGRDRLRRDISGIHTGGMTDLSSGYLRGLQEAQRVCGPTGATIVLLSDGHANSGVRDPDQLKLVAAGASGTAGQRITTSTIGIGLDYDETLLSAIAAGGLGNHAFAEHADAAAAAVAGELEGLLAKTVQAAHVLITPTADVAGVSLLNDGLNAQRVPDGILVELGDFYSGERRKIVLTLRVPQAAGLGLAQVAELTLTYVELPALKQHTVTIPISVNVVPADIAAGRVPNPEVQREVLLLSAQAEKRRAEAALRRGDLASAADALGTARQRLADSDPALLDAELVDEIVWLEDTQTTLRDRDARYNLKRMHSSSTRAARGYKTRTQGGEVGKPDADGKAGKGGKAGKPGSDGDGTSD